MTTPDQGQLEDQLDLPHGALKSLAGRLGVNYNTLRREYSEAKRAGFQDQARAYTDAVAQATQDQLVPAAPMFPQVVRFGAIGDTHLCSKYERLDVLEALYDAFQAAGVDRVFHTGNYIDGDKFPNDVHTHTLDGQVDYFVQKYPRRDGITTHYIAGDDHEGWWVQKGIDVGRYTQAALGSAGRTDLKYLGYMEADVEVGPGLVVRVVHSGGGSGHSISLTSQKLVDSLAHGSARDQWPTLMLSGHYHKAHWLPDYKGVHVFQTGCTVEQSPFMRKLKLAADLGGWIITLRLDAVGRLASVAGEYLGYTARKWTHVQRMGQLDAALKGLGPIAE
jgi:hypothetical protein